ncbi:MAG TPA: M23 family metallopeptidase, partial [Beutenbergiaceae bacterium]|nr:M23 family metallopeptidase [Beutenbergiaceae bacterium]
EARIPAFAKGGLAKKGWALVGEEGPELVNFSAPGRVYTAEETRKALAGTSDIGATDSLPPMGGGGKKPWYSRAWDSVKGAGSAAISWVRGGLAKAAEMLLGPIRNLIAPTVSQWGTFGEFAGGAMTSSIDSLVKWIRGKDTDPDTSGDGGGALLPGGWHRPSRGRVTSRFGFRPGLAGVTGSSFHNGTDFAGGGATYAARAGTVLATGWNILPTNSGIGILIGHGGGFATYYGHNPVGGVKVKTGQEVKGGQRVGTEGSTGNVTGDHLHFGVRRNGKFIDPRAVGIYDEGGLLKPGMLAYHSSRMSKPDAVLTARQWDTMREIAAGRGDEVDYARLEQMFERAVERGSERGTRVGAREGLDATSRRAGMGAGQNMGW